MAIFDPLKAAIENVLDQGVRSNYGDTVVVPWSAIVELEKQFNDFFVEVLDTDE